MSAAKPSSKRPRLQCPRCGQIVSYFTYCRHLRLQFCPGGSPNSDSSEPESFSDSTFYNSESESQSSDCEPFFSAPDEKIIFNSSESSDSDSPFEIDSDDSAPELWPESEIYGSDESEDSDNDNSNDNTSVKQVQNVFCLCLSFIQLCYSISDRAIVYFLTLVAALFKFLSSISPDNNTIKTFTDRFPKTLYSLRKKCEINWHVYQIRYLPPLS